MKKNAVVILAFIALFCFSGGIVLAQELGSMKKERSDLIGSINFFKNLIKDINKSGLGAPEEIAKYQGEIDRMSGVLSELEGRISVEEARLAEIKMQNDAVKKEEQRQKALENKEKARIKAEEQKVINARKKEEAQQKAAEQAIRDAEKQNAFMQKKQQELDVLMTQMGALQKKLAKVKSETEAKKIYQEQDKLQVQIDKVSKDLGVSSKRKR